MTLASDLFKTQHQLHQKWINRFAKYFATFVDHWKHFFFRTAIWQSNPVPGWGIWMQFWPKGAGIWTSQSSKVQMPGALTGRDVDVSNWSAHCVHVTKNMLFFVNENMQIAEINIPIPSLIPLIRAIRTLSSNRMFCCVSQNQFIWNRWTIYHAVKVTSETNLKFSLLLRCFCPWKCTFPSTFCTQHKVMETHRTRKHNIWIWINCRLNIRVCMAFQNSKLLAVNKSEILNKTHETLYRVACYRYIAFWRNLSDFWLNYITVYNITDRSLFMGGGGGGMGEKLTNFFFMSPP